MLAVLARRTPIILYNTMHAEDGVERLATAAGVTAAVFQK